MRDDFEDRSYSNNDGTANWVGDWIEDDVDGPGPTDGNIQIRNNGRLRLRDRPDTGTEPSLAREANLLGATIATLNFDWDLRRVETNDSVVIEISSNGGPDWTVLEDFTGLTGTKSGSRSFYITAFAAVDTQIRFRVNNGYDGQRERFRVPFVEIVYTIVLSGTDMAISQTDTPDPVNIYRHGRH